MKENCRPLVESVCRILRNGLEADGGLVDYIDTVFSCPSTIELKQIIGDNANPERDGLLELIFFPDETIQQEIEETLDDAVFSGEDVAIVTDELSRRLLRTTLLFPDGRGILTLDFPEDMIDTFLHRLNLTRRINAELLDSVAEHIAPAIRTAVKVKLRNFRKNLGEKKVQFLAVFFKKMGPDGQIFTCLDFVLDMLEDIDDDAEVFDELTKRRQACRNQLQKTILFEERLKRDNIETLMMRGERAVHLPKSELLMKLALIDHISLSVFGRVAAAARENQDGPGFALQSTDGFRDLVRRLQN
jgi:hypothetical protein